MDLPQGNSKEDIKAREKIIRDFYREWKSANEGQRVYNIDLQDYINIRMVSIVETCEHAAKTYLSTLAVLQLDAILTHAKKNAVVKSDPKSKNQNKFESMILMEYTYAGIGRIKLTVGIKRSNKEKVMYCITALSA